MKTIKNTQVQQLLYLLGLLLISINLVGQEFPEGYKNGLQIVGKKVERNLLGEPEWNDKDSTIYEYDNQQRLIKRENLYFNDTIWIAHSRTLLDYEEDGYVRTDQRWDADVFMEAIHKITEVFNDQNQLIESVEHDWINETWIRYDKSAYQYDEWGNIIQDDYFRIVGNEWVLNRQEISKFDALGNQVLSIFKDFNHAGILFYERVNKIEKDTIDNQIITNYLDLFDEELRVYCKEIEFLSSKNIVDSSYIYKGYWGDTLELSVKIVKEYNITGQLIQSTSFELDNKVWSPFFLLNYEYDNYGHLILEKSFLGSGAENSWADYLVGQKEYTYTENSTLIKEVDYTQWVIEYEPWEAYDRNITYYANPLTVSVDLFPKDFSVHIFPNPTPQQLTIKLNGNIDYPLQLTIINLQGQILQQQRLDTGLNTINLLGIPKGTYFAQIRDGLGKMEVSKVIKH